MSIAGCKGFIRADKADFLVGASCPEKPGEYTYQGPVARVSYDKDWLYICTDDYEGNAMLDIEALPYLRRALAQIAKRTKVRRLR
jgi:hypothetical protein